MGLIGHTKDTGAEMITKHEISITKTFNNNGFSIFLENNGGELILNFSYAIDCMQNKHIEGVKTINIRHV